MATPGGSRPGGRLARDSGTSIAVAARPTRATGTFIKKTQPHQWWVRIHPPRIGPMGIEMKLAPAHTPTALGRSSSENRTVRAERAMTMIPAPAIPSTTRDAMKAPTLGE